MDKVWWKERFINVTLPYTRTTREKNKHSHYLFNVMFKDGYNKDYARDYLDDKDLEMLFEILWPSMRELQEKQLKKGEKMIADGNFDLSSQGGSVQIKSEGSTKTYNVGLKELTCDCPYGRKLKYSGLFCKHVACVVSMMGLNTIQNLQSSPSPVNTVNTEHKNVRRLTLRD